MILGMLRSKLHSPVLAGYEESTSPYYAAARLWLDAIIDPLETRTWISMGIEAASQAPATREFNMGVFDVGSLGVPSPNAHHRFSRSFIQFAGFSAMYCAMRSCDAASRMMDS